MPLSATELNRLADDIVGEDLLFYVHTGAPGAAGITCLLYTSPSPRDS